MWKVNFGESQERWKNIIFRREGKKYTVFGLNQYRSQPNLFRLHILQRLCNLMIGASTRVGGTRLLETNVDSWQRSIFRTKAKYPHPSPPPPAVMTLIFVPMWAMLTRVLTRTYYVRLYLHYCPWNSWAFYSFFYIFSPLLPFIRNFPYVCDLNITPFTNCFVWAKMVLDKLGNIQAASLFIFSYTFRQTVILSL